MRGWNKWPHLHCLLSVWENKLPATEQQQAEPLHLNERLKTTQDEFVLNEYFYLKLRNFLYKTHQKEHRQIFSLRDLASIRGCVVTYSACEKEEHYSLQLLFLLQVYTDDFEVCVCSVCLFICACHSFFLLSVFPCDIRM